MVVGYARVSTKDQSLDSQLDALKAAGAERIYKEKMSGGRSDRPVLAEMLSYLRSGDSIIVYDLSRLGRDLKHLLELMDELKGRGINLIILQGFGTEPVDTGTAIGSFIFTVFAAVSDFQRQQIREKTIAGLESARLRGRVGGRPKIKEEKIRHALALYDSQNYSLLEIQSMSGVSKASLYRYLKQRNK